MIVVNVSRRDFLRKAGWAGVGGAVAGLGPTRALASQPRPDPDALMGVLVDIPNCIGCRQCEAACKEANGFEVSTDDELKDRSVFAEHRRPDPQGHTAVNSFPSRFLFRLEADLQDDLNHAAEVSAKRLEEEQSSGEDLQADSGNAEDVLSERLAEAFSRNGIFLARDVIVTTEEPGHRWALVSAGQAFLVRREDGVLSVRELGPIYVKANCLHCNEPACVSACLVGAFRKLEDGPVVYDAWKCMGCRYCMVACPFQIPTYEYDNLLTPQVRKCTLCANEGNPYKGGVPACVQKCPTDCLTYGKRSELLARAHAKIEEQPDVYSDHIYGEHEVGGTSWLYLGPKAHSFEQLGFLNLGSSPPPMRTERIQHGIFKYFIPPLAWYGLLGAMMWVSRPDADETEHASAKGYPE